VPRSRKGDDDEKDDVKLEAESELDAEEADELSAVPAEDQADDDDAEELDVPATAAGKASAARLLDLLVEKKALALHAKKPGTELIEAVGRVLESPLPIKARANKLSDAIVDSEDVDELFLDDETLIELLKRW
jgi:hypothetical protein